MMATDERFDESVSSWFEQTAQARLPERVLEATFERTRGSRQQTGWRGLVGSMQVNRTVAAVAGVAVVVVAIASQGLDFNQPGVGRKPPAPTAEPSPTATAAPTNTPMVFVEEPVDGQALEWSSDGTRLLVKKGDGNLFVLHDDGSETQVTEQLSELGAIPGSARPSGATISPDGSRVVFAGLTKRWTEGNSCHDGALFAVDADGGPAEVIWESQRDGIVRYPTFSPDGTQIAFVDGYCDSDHSVWVMNADGSDPHQIVTSEIGPLGAGHVQGLAWSAAGDRIALLFEGGAYTFAKDGSDFTQGGVGAGYCWPGRQC